MTKIYDGSGKTTYTLNSGRVIVLDDEEFDELVVGSEKIKELQDNIMELEVEVACKNKTIDRLEDDMSGYDDCRATLRAYEEDEEIVQLILKLRKLGNTDSEDFLSHIERTAKAILGGKK